MVLVVPTRRATAACWWTCLSEGKLGRAQCGPSIHDDQAIVIISNAATEPSEGLMLDGAMEGRDVDPPREGTGVAALPVPSKSLPHRKP